MSENVTDVIADLDRKRVDGIRERVKRMERGEKDPHVQTWEGAYYGDVYFLLGLLQRERERAARNA